MFHRECPDFLGASLSAALLDHAICNEARFETAGLGRGNEIDARVRVSRRLVDLGELRAAVEERVLRATPALVGALRLSAFEASGVELELAAHEDGAFYRRHVDLFTGPGERGKGSSRLLSIVVYLQREPRHYTGGALRLFPQTGPGPAGGGDEPIEVHPRHGLGVAFSSWLPHEVLPVHAPGEPFAHSRFALNCWVLR